MILCPSCKHANMAGAVFCDDCGAQLTGREEMITQSITTDQVLGDTAAQAVNRGYQIPGDNDTWGDLHLLDTGQVLPLSKRSEFTLGRISEGQPIVPDIDLASFQAYASGVSRMHALIKRDGARVLIMDLGSANGTYLNGRRLSANMEQPLNHGDVIALGKLKMQILLKI
ncbi:MAG: hypothetical protein A2Z03_08415 [Chloroflexi bacterium RBG_16_56_8]|nr:MAG: hypothetical protein A2Z03_08415 [Chloroflexi bacterium RBG_16_56_8]